MRLLVCLREPVDRAFSDYLDLVKNGQFSGDFETALGRHPRLLERGRYATHLSAYLEVFPRDQLCVQLFDDLRADPQSYADQVHRFLEVSPRRLPPTDLQARMPAGVPRSRGLASAARSGSRIAKRVGLRRLRSRVKRSAGIRRALYRPYAGDRPVLDPALRDRLRLELTEEVRLLDTLLGLPVSQRWGYGTVRDDLPAR
jgi:hypothetical protein